MLSLPSLAPQDSYTLWYSSSTSTNPSPYLETHESDPSQQPRNQQANPYHRRHALQRTPLARLRHDEEYMERRKLNIQNYGSSWIKPPGVAKSLYQQREEEREMREHQEALRREQLAQELADAEAEVGMLNAEGEGDGEGEMEEARDLDDDVPDADNTALDEEESDNSDEENEIEEVSINGLANRVPDPAYLEAIIRGSEIGLGNFGGDGAGDEEDHSGMLQEEDLVHENVEQQDEDMDMDADLDADIPEADAGGYEHTDTEAELTSSDDDESVDAGRLPTQFAASSMVRSDGTQNSMDLSSLISGGSSQVGSSSPRQRMSLRGRGWHSSGNYPQ